MKFTLPPLLIAERFARQVLEQFGIQPGRKITIPFTANDTDAWKVSFARLAYSAGMQPELIVRHDQNGSHLLVGLLAVATYRLGIPFIDESAIHKFESNSLLDKMAEEIKHDNLAPDAILKFVQKYWLESDDICMLRRYTAQMPVYLTKAVRNLDTWAIDKLQLPSVCLMENAAIGALIVAYKLLCQAGIKPGDKDKIIIAAGSGNNGGDALAIARGLIEFGYGSQLIICLTAHPDRLTSETRINMEILAQAAYPTGDATDSIVKVHYILHEDSLSELIPTDTPIALIIDGLLGTGGKGQPRGQISYFIQLINRLAGKNTAVLALDIPSGLNSDTGESTHATIQASATVAFVAAKPGLVAEKAKKYVGDLYIADIGIPCRISAETQR